MRSLVRSLVALVVLSTVTMFVSGCFGEHRPRILLLGIDGATWKAITPLMEQGRLPNISRLTLDGTWGPLQPFKPYLSPRVWTSIATGKKPENHGILGWVKPDGEDGATLYYSGDRNGHALWNIYSDAGSTVASVNWLVTYPPEIVNGVVVSDHALSGESQARADLGALFATAQGREFETAKAVSSPEQAIFPTDWNARVLDSRHSNADLTSIANPFLSDRVLPSRFYRDRLAEFFERDQELVSIALEIDTATKPDLMMVLLQGIDRASHSLWACIDDEAVFPEDFTPTREELRNCHDMLYEYYEYTDQLIGRFLDRYTRNDLVMVLSDHGFESNFSGSLTGGHTSLDAALGVIMARGPRIEAGKLLAPTEVTVYDIAPTVLAWSGKPMARDMDGKVAPFLMVDEEHPLAEPIDTYATTPIERVGDNTSGGEAVILDQLQSLGYVD
jgi:predicted AlkP superfamily phosphohydrolase/phosphomutase